MDEETEANPADGDEVTAEQAQLALTPEEGAEASDAIEDDLDKLAGLDAQEGEPETVDIEIDGKTYKVPAEIKDGYLRQADYTKKTMTVAEEKRQLAEAKAAIEELGNLSKERLDTVTGVVAARQELARLEATPIDGLSQDQINALRLDHSDLTNRISQLERRGGELTQQERYARDQQIAKAREAAAAEAARYIPDFDSRRASISEFLASEGENPEQVISTIDNPAVWKVLNYADIGKKFVERQRKAKNIADAQQVKPAAQVGGKARTDKSPDAMSPAEMAKHLGY